MPPARRKNPEEQLQQSIVAWARLRARTCPDLDVLYHPANGGLRSKSEAGRFKAGGVLPGVSDLHLPAKVGSPGIWIELKSPTGKLSPAQLDWLSRMCSRGERVALVRTSGAAIMVLAWHLGRSDLLGDLAKCERLTLETSMKQERSGTALALLSFRFHALGHESQLDALQMTREQGLTFSWWVKDHRPELIDHVAK